MLEFIPPSLLFVGMHFNLDINWRRELCEGLTEIGEFAFYDCRALKYINIPSTVKTIDSFAFCWTPLQTLRLPGSIESLGVVHFVMVDSLMSEYHLS